MKLHGKLNPTFQNDSGFCLSNLRDESQVENTPKNEEKQPKKRDEWGHQLEFLMSCISMSVGLGNVWRFPYSVYKNGGGAFLIPYICVLFLVGKPLYFLEMVLGQFSSKGSVKVFDFSPAMRGVGTGQTIAISCAMSYYAALMAIIIYYMFGSLTSVLPWSVCDPEWTDPCYSSGNIHNNLSDTIGKRSSSELYFRRVVLREYDNIDDGIGAPEWKLTLCLLMAWVTVLLVLLKGVKTAGKASYFLAIFPYIIMTVLLIKAATLPGAMKGIIFFIKPDFNVIFEARVWYSAVTQCFFSLSICFGPVIMYSSFNNFKHKIYRDAMIVTTLDAFTSMLAGFTIFGILGNLAHESGKPVDEVVKRGSELAFVSYPDAISKFENVPQLFSFLFFFMLYVLGVGANVAMASSIVTVLRDKFPRLKRWMAISGVAICSFCISLVYITPGGQWILGLVDHHGASFTVYLLGISELIAVFYIYGIRRICNDIEFMLGFKVGFYWRLCWAIVTPLFLIVIFIYSLIQLKPIQHGKQDYPVSAIVFGWILTTIGVLQLPIFIFIAIYKRKEIIGLTNKIRSAFSPHNDWGPADPDVRQEWIAFTEMKKQEQENIIEMPRWKKVFCDVFGY